MTVPAGRVRVYMFATSMDPLLGDLSADTSLFAQ